MKFKNLSDLERTVTKLSQANKTAEGRILLSQPEDLVHLGMDSLFQLERIYELFNELGDELLEAIFANETLKNLFVSSRYSINRLFDIFCGKPITNTIRANVIYKKISNDLPMMQRLMNTVDDLDYFCAMLVDQALSHYERNGCFVRLLELSAQPNVVNHFRKSSYFLSDFISRYMDQSLIIVDWAKKNNLTKNDDEYESILKKAGELKAQRDQEIEEKLEQERLQQEWELRRPLREARQQILEWSIFKDKTITPLHKLAAGTKSIFANSTSPDDIIRANDLLENASNRERATLLEARTSNGNTPLIAAVIAANREMILLLLSWGAKVNVQNNQGFSPADLQFEYYEDEQPPYAGFDDGVINLFKMLAKWEETYLTNSTHYAFDKIKPALAKILNDSDRRFILLPIDARDCLRSYFFNHVDHETKKEVLAFFESVRHECYKDTPIRPQYRVSIETYQPELTNRKLV